MHLNGFRLVALLCSVDLTAVVGCCHPKQNVIQIVSCSPPSKISTPMSVQYGRWAMPANPSFPPREAHSWEVSTLPGDTLPCSHHWPALGTGKCSHELHCGRTPYKSRTGPMDWVAENNSIPGRNWPLKVRQKGISTLQIEGFGAKCHIGKKIFIHHSDSLPALTKVWMDARQWNTQQGRGLGLVLRRRRPCLPYYDPWAVQLSKYIIVLHKEEQHREKIQPVSFLSGKLSLRIEMEINTVAWTSEMMTLLSCFSVKLAGYLHTAYCKTGCGWESSRVGVWEGTLSALNSEVHLVFAQTHFSHPKQATSLN